jgi:aflatoxin B1 aldehyde reductase
MPGSVCPPSSCQYERHRHAPDHSTPFEETLKGVNDLYKEGKFEIFGISNYASWEVAEIVQIARSKGWVQPMVLRLTMVLVHGQADLAA